MTTEFRAAILGKTGAGKSSLGNSLLGKRAFKSSLSGSSISKQCERGYGPTSIGNLLVVDTPGLFDTTKPNAETIGELVKCIGLLAPGPHVFIFVLSVDRFTRDDIETAEILKKTFGEGTTHHVIVVFTRKDHLDDDETTVQQYIDATPEVLKQLLKDVNNRYEFICNKQKSNSHQQDVENVLKLIEKTVQQNGGSYYTQNMFQTAEDVIQKEIRERQKKENKSDEEYRQEIQNDIANNDQNIMSKILEMVTVIIRETLPHLIDAVGAYFAGKNSSG